MEQQILNSIVDVQPTIKRDINAPYSFLEWSQTKPSVLEEDLFVYYKRYVIEWFRNNKDEKVAFKFLLRQKYLFLLDQLQLYFTEEEKNNWYKKINLADEKELLLSIPYFAKKLKNISLYYLKLRKRLKNVKLRYNSVGSVRGIEQEIYQHVLENFTSENQELDPSLQKILPTLDTLKSQLVVKVEEYYDDGEYFDKSEYFPLSGYIDIFHEANTKLFSSKGIVLSSDDWIFRTFTFSASAEVDTFVSSVTSLLTEQTEEGLYQEHITKLLSEKKYKLEFPQKAASYEQFNIPLQIGNNYFYYPYGITDTSLSIQEPITPVPLSSLQIKGATAGMHLSAADTIFVKNGDTIKSAWLYANKYDEELETVKCLINKNTSTSFIFPFPGYGLSAEDIDWTGSTLETEDEYQFLPPLIKAAVNEAYWSQVLPSDSTEELLLCETTLIEDGAKAGKSPDTSDNIFITTKRNNDTLIPKGTSNGSWLYRFEQAALPVSKGSENVILWPYSRVDQITSEPLLQYLSTASLTSVCSTIPVQKLDTSYFVAASAFEYADKIYKLENYEQAIKDATECCWLSSGSNIYGDNKYFSQNGVSYLFNPGIATKFVWSGPTVPLSSVFIEVAHQDDCPFLKTKNKSADWHTCSCKQVYYSPYGHSEKTFHFRNNQHADFICAAPTNLSEEFDIQNWKDSSQNTFETSNNFAWYKTPIEPTWGGGRWVKANGAFSSMLLETGKAYIYRRADSRIDTPFPPYVVFKKFENTRDCHNQFYTNAHKKVKWISAKKDGSGQWISADVESRMLIGPGDFINVDRQESTTSFYLSSIIVERTSQNINSIWSGSDYLVFDKSNPQEPSNTTISWPTESALFRDNRYPGQSPSVEVENLSAILAWRVVLDNNPVIGDTLFSPYRDGVYNTYQNGTLVVSPLRTYQNVFSFTFVPPQTGTYSISVTAVDNLQNIYTFPNASVTIPKLSVVPQYTTEKIEIPVVTPNASILLEHPLSGWNYTASDIGAKPYWAVIDSEKTPGTKYKGIKEWGYTNEFFDEYIPILHPNFSPLTINYGNIIDYVRRNSRNFYWNQPVLYKTENGVPKWCALTNNTFATSNLSSFFDISLQNVLQVFPTLSTTDIILSNNLNGAPVEIFYNALSSFTWTITAEVNENSNITDPTSLVYYNVAPTFNLNMQSRFYPNVAVLPTLDKLYSQKDSGAYFITQNLGASQYLNTNFTADLKTSDLTGSHVTEDPFVHIGGRGLSRTDHSSIYEWQENNEWLKEPPVSSKMAGYVKKNLTKTLQTFIPYQTNNLDNTLGIINTTNNFSPWGGTYKDEWVDKTNEPKSFTGIRSVSAWQNAQELNKTQKSLDAWVSDIYGNQYGLFKDWNQATLSERKKIGGELWIKTNNGSIQSAAVASLSSLFDQFSSNKTIYSELTGKRILDVDCFFDTLMIATSSVLIFSKISYDYEAGKIETNTDDTFFKQLTANQFELERTWFLSQEKNVFSLFTEITSDCFFPVLYKYEINSNKNERQFPTTFSDTNALRTVLSAYTPNEGCLTYNESTRTFGITYQATDYLDDIVFINIKLKRLEDIKLESIEVYENKHRSQTITMPPIVPNYHLSAVPVIKNTPFTYTITALNNPTTYKIINSGLFSQISLNSSGTFSGTITAAGLYHVHYSLSNQIGSTEYSLTLSAR